MKLTVGGLALVGDEAVLVLGVSSGRRVYSRHRRTYSVLLSNGSVATKCWFELNGV